MRNIVLLPLAALAASAVACTNSQQQGPQVASSSSQTTYAASYPDDLQAASKAVADDRNDAHTLSTGFAQRAGDLKGPTDTDTLVAVVDRADEAGRSQAFVARRADTRTVRQFWDEERPTITGRVAGAAQQKVSDAKCENADVGGAVAYSLKDGVDKQLEKRLRAKNEGQLLLERYKTSIGQPNAGVMQKLADDVAQASYLVNVALEEDRNRVTRLMADKGSIDSTLKHAIDDEQAFQKEKGRTDAEKKASDARIAELQKAQAALGGAVVNAEVATRGIDDQIKQARTEYADALKALEDQIKKLPKPEEKK
jgi:hypothetical protein